MLCLPPTFGGRFRSLCLHVWLASQRLRFLEKDADVLPASDPGSKRCVFISTNSFCTCIHTPGPFADFFHLFSLDFPPRFPLDYPSIFPSISPRLSRRFPLDVPSMFPRLSLDFPPPFPLDFPVVFPSIFPPFPRRFSRRFSVDFPSISPLFFPPPSPASWPR